MIPQNEALTLNGVQAELEHREQYHLDLLTRQIHSIIPDRKRSNLRIGPNWNESMPKSYAWKQIVEHKGKINMMNSNFQQITNNTVSKDRNVVAIFLFKLSK